MLTKGIPENGGWETYARGPGQTARRPCLTQARRRVAPFPQARRTDRREDGRVRGQRDSRQGIAVEIQARQKLAGDVLGVSGAAVH